MTSTRVTASTGPGPSGTAGDGRYRWVALSNTTLGVLMATLDASIVIISMPAIFRGIHLDPFAPGNISYLLWLVLGYLLVTAALVVALGRLGDLYGRVRMYNLGFAIFSGASLALSLDPLIGPGGALWLIVWRIVQAVGGAMLMANSAAILTDAFPANQRGMALGINQIAGLAGQFLGLLAGGLLAAKVAEPMFHLGLFRIRAFAAGNTASLLASVSRGGLQFMLIIWLQGIWLPLHGFAYQDTPLWAGIYLLPLTAGFLVAGPLAGHLSDRFGARTFATGGLVLVACSFAGLLALPVDFPYAVFAALILLNGAGQGLFSAPNTAAIMSSVPASHRGAASGMRATFVNSGVSLSIGIFFSLMIAGLAASLPYTLSSGLRSQGVPAVIASHVSQLPPVSTMFAAFLGYNPIANLLRPTGVLATLPSRNTNLLTGKEFFPNLISQPFHHGLIIVFTAAAAMALSGALASLLRGGRYHHDEPGAA